MRPVNLIPAEERPGGRKPLRSGPLAYILVGALAAAVIALTAVVVTEDKISDRKAEVTRLQQEQTSVETKAQALAAYTQFSTVREQRVATVESLADSRFAWERVLDELSLVLPRGIQLTSLSGTASPEVSSAGGAGIAMRGQIAGPALELAGCAPSQADVASFVEALKGIDGVTRVGMQQSSSAGAGENATSASNCGTIGSIQFQMVAAFDAAPPPPSESAETVSPEVTTESTSESESESTSGEATTSEPVSSESSSGEAGAD